MDAGASLGGSGEVLPAPGGGLSWTPVRASEAQAKFSQYREGMGPRWLWYFERSSPAP